MQMEYVSDTIRNLPPYLFSEIQRNKEKLEARGIDVIDLGIGAPDLPTPDFIVDRLTKEAQVPENHRYPIYSGISEFKEAVAHFYDKHYDVKLDPQTEVLALIGSKEGIAHLMQAVLNPNDTVLVPDPGYPVYATGVHLAGGRTVPLPLDPTNGFVPLYDTLSQADKEKARLMLLNYPGNPTAATVTLDTFQEAVAFAKEHRILLANDAAYDLITFSGYKAPSVLQVPGAKDYAVEFGSLSKSFSMTGWRIGYMVGNKTAVHALATLKSNLDSGQFIPIQKAGATALESDLDTTKEYSGIYEERMEALYKGLVDLGFEVEKPRGTIFVWAKVPEGHTSAAFANQLLDEAGVIVTPGNAFGTGGEGYFRIALSVSKERLEEVLERLGNIAWGGGG